MSSAMTASKTGAATGENPATPRVLGLFTTQGLAMIALLALVFFGLFYRWFLKQNQHSWGALEDWGHAYVIPLISGYLIWRCRDKLAAIRPRVFWPGLAPLLLGMVTYFAGVVTIRNHMIQGFAIVLSLFGLTLLLTGPRYMRYLFIPIGYLVFAVTVSEAIMLAVTFKLQLIASKGGYLLLSVLGQGLGLWDWFTVTIDGNRLDIMRGTLRVPMNVAEACSGMRMVVAFLALSVAVALLACREWWQRVLLMLLAAPVAILMNVVRVAVLGLVSLADPNLASGDAHTVIGTILLFPSLLLYLGIVWVLNRVIESPEEAKA
ncbi:MAG: exosortase/archaeosortase family protein [Phycisphaerales bacterium]